MKLGSSSSAQDPLEERVSLLSATDALNSTDSTIFSTVAQRDRSKPWILLVSLACVLIAMVDMGRSLAEAPRIRVYEANLCLAHYRQHDTTVIGADGTVPERLCKIDAIQQKMAVIFGWEETFDAIPSIFLAIPFGTLADRVGRKWVLAGSLVGLQLNSVWALVICYCNSLPLQLTWLSSVFYFIGGGPIVAFAIGTTMISDIAPHEKRTAIFLYLTASVLVTEMVAPILSVRLMESGEWTPLVISPIIQLAGTMLAIAFPETLHLRDLPESRTRRSRSMEPRTNGNDSWLKSQLKHFEAAYHFLKYDWTLALIIFTFMANRLGGQVTSLLLRYASKRYNWEIKKSAYLLSFRAATNLVAIVVYIPLVNVVLLRYVNLPPYVADLWIARGSIILTAISFLIIGLASHPALLILGLLVHNLGTGFSAAMRSVCVHVIGGQSSSNIGKLMSTIAIVESLGAVIAGPLLNQMFQWGMQVGNEWLGLPFLAAMVMFVGISIITFIVDVNSSAAGYDKVPSEDDDQVGEEQEGTSTARDDAPTYTLSLNAGSGRR